MGTLYWPAADAATEATTEAARSTRRRYDDSPPTAAGVAHARQKSKKSLAPPPSPVQFRQLAPRVPGPGFGAFCFGFFACGFLGFPPESPKALIRHF
jgi:hypothetical protein